MGWSSIHRGGGIVIQTRLLFVFTGLLCWFSTGAWGQSVPQPSQGAAVAATTLRQAQAAVVQITARAIEGAPSARTLGQVRRGSGVVIGPDDLILTIGYLILETDQVDIRTMDRKTYPATVVAYDTATGLGLLRPLFPLINVQPVKIGQVEASAVGETFAVASGESAETIGPARLVDVRAFTGYWEYHLDKALYASPPMANHSGAALFNPQGELVGIGSLYMPDVLRESDPRSLPGNMFVPSELLNSSLAELLATGSSADSHRPWLGINAVERNGRIQITRVTPASPAAKAGLSPGDVVLSLDGEVLTSLARLYKKVWAKPLDAGSFTLTVQDRGRVRDLQLEVRDRSLSIQKPAGI